MYDQLCQAIKEHSHFAVISHFRPDGDAIGSTLAMGFLLALLGKKVHLWNADPVPARFAFLEGADKIRPIPPVLPDGVDALICVDAGDLRRIGDNAAGLFRRAPFTINIDHHISNERYAEINAVDPNAPACGFIIFNLVCALGLPMSKPLAAALYAAISTDTGSFQYPSTTPATMRAAAELLESGIDVGEINRLLYQEEPLSAFTVKRDVLNRMQVEEQGKIVHYSLTESRKRELGLTLDDTKDLVDIIRVLQGAKAAAIFEEVGEGRIRISLRSKDPAINVSTIAAQFGGGGHSMAAGIRMRGDIGHCRRQVLDAIRTHLPALPCHD